MRKKEWAFSFQDSGNSDPTFWEAYNQRIAPLPIDAGIGSRSWGPDRVYFIHAPAINAIKIGYSKNPQKRKKALAQAGIRPLVLLGVLNGGVWLEKLMHERFAAHRRFGEWFSDEIQEEAEQFIRRDHEYYGPAPT